ncbi:hypothetical protein HDU97_002333 [Phlyctochytrium planicorne]|nr:hypothetical protein HDU97_002333 [Phlyctochytrium planicorne]
MESLKGLGEKISSFSLKYGPAWIIIIQTLGWISFGILYAILAFSGVDVGVLARSYNLSKELIALADTGGLLALTFGINRLFAPVRIFLALLIVPKVADPINKVVRPWIKMVFGDDEKKKEDDKTK